MSTKTIETTETREPLSSTFADEFARSAERERIANRILSDAAKPNVDTPADIRNHRNGH